MDASTVSARAEDVARMHLRVITDWTARHRETPVEPHLLDELARDIGADVLALALLPEDADRDCHVPVKDGQLHDTFPVGTR